MRSGSRRYLVARRPDRHGKGRGAVVGYAGLWFAVDEAHVTNVAVAPAQQRTGVATALLRGVGRDEHRARVRCVDARGAGVVGRGTGAVPPRSGSSPAGVRARYYENTEDAIVMWCNDIQGDEYRALLGSIRTETEQRWTS